MRYFLALVDKDGDVFATLDPDGAFHPHSTKSELDDNDEPKLNPRSGEIERKPHPLESEKPPADAFKDVTLTLVNDDHVVVWPYREQAKKPAKGATPVKKVPEPEPDPADVV